MTRRISLSLGLSNRLSSGDLGAETRDVIRIPFHHHRLLGGVEVIDGIDHVAVLIWVDQTDRSSGSLSSTCAANAKQSSEQRWECCIFITGGRRLPCPAEFLWKHYGAEVSRNWWRLQSKAHPHHERGHSWWWALDFAACESVPSPHRVQFPWEWNAKCSHQVLVKAF